MVVVFAKQQRGPGLIGPATRDVSGSVQSNSRHTLTALLNAPDLQDPTYTITDFHLEGTTDPTGTNGWHTLAKSDWTGGQAAIDKFTQQTVFAAPSITFFADNEMPLWVRISLNTPRRTAIGLDHSVAPATLL